MQRETMLSKVLKVIAIVILIHSNMSLALAYEEPTHQSFAGVSVQLSENLKRVIKEMELGEATYDTKAIQAASKITKYSIAGSGPVSMIIAGVILEDEPFRYLNHFRDGLSGKGLKLPLKSPYPSSSQWGYNYGSNDYDWVNGIEYARLGFLSKSQKERSKYQGEMFRSVGQVLHLVQDAYQPSHTRNDPHTKDSELENWAKANVNPAHFNNSVWYGVTAQGLGTFYASTFFEYFSQSSNFSNTKFFSDDTIIYSFDEDDDIPYAEPSFNSTKIESSSSGQKYVVSKLLDSPGSIGSQGAKLARQVGIIEPEYTLQAPGGAVCIDNLKHLAFLAIGRGAGLIDHFFRGGISASLSTDDPTRLLIKNISSYGSALKGGEFELRYETESGLYLPLPGFEKVSLSGTLTVNGEYLLPGNITSVMSDLMDTTKYPSVDKHARSDGRVIIYYGGKVGKEEGWAVTKTNVQGSFIVTDIDGPTTVVANTGSAPFKANWEGTAQFPVTVDIVNTYCPPNFNCFNQHFSVNSFSNPVNFGMAGWGCGVGTFYTEWDFVLTDSSNVSSEGLNFPVTFLFDGSGCSGFSALGNDAYGQPTQ